MRTDSPTPSAAAVAPSSSISAEAIHAQAQQYMQAARAPNTRRAYASDWRQFADWCAQQGVPALPAEARTVALYLTALGQAGRKVSTIARKATALGQAHVTAEHPSPTQAPLVREVLKGIRRTHGVAPTGVAPLLTEDLRLCMAHMPDTLKGHRDRALLLLGFAAALRRSELVALNVEDITPCAEGLLVRIGRSKTDQDGVGRVIGIPYGTRLGTCPVRSYKAWVAKARLVSGPAFVHVARGGRLTPTRLSDRAVALIIKEATARAGLDPARFAGHSLRVGHITCAARACVPERIIMRQSGHRSERSLRRYVREASLFEENSARALGL